MLPHTMLLSAAAGRSESPLAADACRARYTGSALSLPSFFGFFFFRGLGGFSKSFLQMTRLLVRTLILSTARCD
jgi:hypothetical protein